MPTVPASEEHISRAGERAWNNSKGLFRGCEGCQLSCVENHIPDGVVAVNVVSIAHTAYLVVTEDVSSTIEFRAGEEVVVDGNT